MVVRLGGTGFLWVLVRVWPEGTREGEGRGGSDNPFSFRKTCLGATWGWLVWGPALPGHSLLGEIPKREPGLQTSVPQFPHLGVCSKSFVWGCSWHL